MQYKTFSDYVREFEILRLKEILKNGELYMFDTKLTKEEHEKIVRDFEQIVNGQKSSNLENENQCEKIKDSKDEIEKILNLKNFS